MEEHGAAHEAMEADGRALLAVVLLALGVRMTAIVVLHRGAAGRHAALARGLSCASELAHGIIGVGDFFVA